MSDTNTGSPVFHLTRFSYENLHSLGEGIVYDIDLVRALCRELADEADPDKTEELISLLQAVVKDDQEEVKVRMAFLAKKYAHFFSDSRSKAAD